MNKLFQLILSNKNVILFFGDDKMKLNSWLSEIDDNRELFALNLPATHDSVTDFVQFSYITKCQNMSISQQLNIGIRSLDLRVQVRDERLKMVHAFAKVFTDSSRSEQMDLSDVLSQCYDFLDKNKSEAIIIQFKNDSGRDYEKSFDILFSSYIKGNEDKWFLENRSPLLSEARGKIVLIRRCKMNDREEYTDKNTGIDFSRWEEQTTKEPHPLPLNTGGENGMKFLVQDRFKYSPKPRWNEVIRPFLSSAKPFDGTYIINYLSTAGGIKGPKRNAEYINSEFMKYPLDNKNYYGTIYMDFPAEKITQKIINTNI